MATGININDKRFHQLTLAIQKAINSIETPVKEKHVRSTIIGTFQEQSAITYWMVAVRLPLQDNRIVAWKFCHVTHKLLREGHPACLDDSQRHIGMIENLGRLWVHLREGYGKLVHLYSNLLVCKLKFHARNPRFPGNMQLTADELDAIAENDVNNYFQLCVELFDYMDDILTLQASVFDSLGNARANSMTASGQCRLAALIPCAQDASHIYDCNVRLLFRLHAALPADTLAGHRERFRQQFKKLGSFYKHASSLQYYRNLLTLPLLPSNPPNFLLQSDFGTYVTPVVSVPEPPPDDVDAIGSLIDTSDTFSQATTPDHLEAFDTRATPSPQPDPLVERDRLIDHLQNELKRLRLEVSQMVHERNTMLGSMREHCTRLESQLQTTKTELEEEKQKAEILSIQTPEIKLKLTETEEKAKVTDEKFQKLKGAYTQLREEHIMLIRQKAEMDKMAASLRGAAAQHESAKMALQQQLNDRIKDVELLQQSASTSEEIEAYKNEISNLRSELEQSRQKEVELETLRASMEALEIEHKTATTEQQEKVTIMGNELKEVTENLEKIRQEKEERESELCKVNEELLELKEKSNDEYKRVVGEKEDALKQIAELTQQHRKEKEEQVNCINNLQVDLENMQQKLKETETKFTTECENLNEQLHFKNNEYEVYLNKKDVEITEALEKVVALQTELENTKINYDNNNQEQTTIMLNLEEKINELTQYKETNTILVRELIEEKDKIQLELDKFINEIDKLQNDLSEKETEVTDLGNKTKKLTESYDKQTKAYEELENNKNKEISDLNELLQATIVEKDDRITALQEIIAEKTDFSDKQQTQCENLLKQICELETITDTKNREICELQLKHNDTVSALEKQKFDNESLQKDNQYETAILKDKLQNTITSKDEIIDNLKSMLTQKDEQVISVNVKLSKLSDDVTRLEEELKECNAELEIGTNELLTLKEEHDAIIERNDCNLAMKNHELRSLNEEINQLKQEKSDLLSEKEKIINEFTLEQQVFENNIKELNDALEKLNNDFNMVQNEKEDVTKELNLEISNLKSEYEHLKDVKDCEIKSLTEKINNQEVSFEISLSDKDVANNQAMKEIDELKIQLDELHKLKTKEIEDMELVISDNRKEKQILEVRLEHIDRERLNAECELQDLLQHNSVLEADLGALRKQLEAAQTELEKQRATLVSCASEAALEVTSEALAALERCSAHESNRAAAELASKALHDLAAHTEVKGKEESVAKSAIFAAHNTAQLSAYVIEVSNTSTDMELSDKLNNECRGMLTSTKQCLESLVGCVLEGATCAEAGERVRGVARAAAAADRAADRAAAAARSVDDELADMDRAIEEAATQIEDLLAASRAGDTGVKLEVNGKILDACTTLMGAVKILVQDARKLQNELGDPKTRQKMYRRNPQWSEGLISAAKAVVFAAKLLVTSADEAVGAAGRVEGVSAAAHEVGGSTAQLVAASRARAPPASPALARLTHASRAVAAATGAVVAAVRAAAALVNDQEALDTSALTLTATRRLEMESKVRSLELECALDAERAKLAALRKRHYQLAQVEENGNMTNGKE